MLCRVALVATLVFTTMEADIYQARYLPGVASSFVEGVALHLPRGFTSVWKTTATR